MKKQNLLMEISSGNRIIRITEVKRTYVGNNKSFSGKVFTKLQVEGFGDIWVTDYPATRGEQRELRDFFAADNLDNLDKSFGCFTCHGLVSDKDNKLYSNGNCISHSHLENALLLYCRNYFKDATIEEM